MFSSDGVYWETIVQFDCCNMVWYFPLSPNMQCECFIWEGYVFFCRTYLCIRGGFRFRSALCLFDCVFSLLFLPAQHLNINFVTSLFRKYGLHKVWLMHVPVVLIYKPQWVEVGLTHSDCGDGSFLIFFVVFSSITYLATQDWTYVLTNSTSMGPGVKGVTVIN